MQALTPSLAIAVTRIQLVVREEEVPIPRHQRDRKTVSALAEELAELVVEKN